VDITKLLGPQKWTYFYLYAVLDVFSRYVVAWRLEARESQAMHDHDGYGVLTERTSAAQDAAMTARAKALQATSHDYNGITCNCDEFAKDVLSTADPKAAGAMSLIPVTDFNALLLQGYRSGHAGTPPGGLAPITPIEQ
jgi:hypothetical protein